MLLIFYTEHFPNSILNNLNYLLFKYHVMSTIKYYSKITLQKLFLLI